MQRLVLHLILLGKTMPSHRSNCDCQHGTCIPYVNYKKYRCECNAGLTGNRCDTVDLTCANNSIAITSVGRPKCVCPLGQGGPTCRVKLHPCKSDTCLNNGTCVAFPEQLSPQRAFICICQMEYAGQLCKTKAGIMNIYFDKSLLLSKRIIPAMIVHFMYVLGDTRKAEFTHSFRTLYKSYDTNTPMTISYNPSATYVDVAFVQLFITADELYGKYYLILRNNTQSHRLSMKDRLLYVNTTVTEQNYCPYISRLLNKTVIDYVQLKRVKYYQIPCRNEKQLVCFHDNIYMCLCDKYRSTKCFLFVQNRNNCTGVNFCSKNGLCLQNNEKINPLNYQCLCLACYYGDVCQFTTSDFSISLDGLVGQQIAADAKLTDQPAIIQIILAAMIIMVICGLGLNVLTVLTFCCVKCQEVGCGLYILCSSILGQASLLMLSIKFIHLLHVQTSKSTPSSISCILIEYLKKDSGFGFNVRGQIYEEGSVKSIDGTLYGPIQHVSTVTGKGSAEKAGLRKTSWIRSLFGNNTLMNVDSIAVDVEIKILFPD
ncbi:unnamed protein product [Didymodactylos carnosus]|uniref:EGF-like domain-containing protein n=1 Tax=Didymodactylos carnosus TaxID=1234261 RepID=A0A8S2HSQ3_9BILA|nr:unnamed protein product [Didymodactylos carnosus]CAF3656735.1 unnamed protein product [Didymodactylos carnosus]